MVYGSASSDKTHCFSVFLSMKPHRVPLPAQENSLGRALARTWAPAKKSDFFLALSVDVASIREDPSCFVSLVGIKLIPPLPRRPFPCFPLCLPPELDLGGNTEVAVKVDPPVAKRR